MPQKECRQREPSIGDGDNTDSFAEGERHLSRALAAKPEVFEAPSRFLVVGQVFFRCTGSMPWNTEQLASVQI